jgi:toxin ParE1/3/4
MSSQNKFTLVLSPEAIDDRKDIVAYTITTWGTEQAKKYNQQLKDAMSAIRKNPGIDKTHPQLPSIYFLYHVGRHYLIYTVTENRVEIVRILHDRMDLPRHV